MSSFPGRLVLAATVALTLLVALCPSTVCADSNDKAPGPKQRAVRLPLGVVSRPGQAPKAVAHAGYLEALRRAGPIAEVAVELLSDLTAKMCSDNEAELLSGNETELFSGNAPELLSGNEAELLSGNETELFSDNAPELLSGNEAELLSENEVQLLSENEAKLASENTAEICSGNRLQFFSNINLNVSIQECGNNNGNDNGNNAGSPPPGRVNRPIPPVRKKPARFGRLDADQSGAVSLREFSGRRSGEKDRRAKKRFRTLDRNGDGMLDFQEFSAPKPAVSPRT